MFSISEADLEWIKEMKKMLITGHFLQHIVIYEIVMTEQKQSLTVSKIHKDLWSFCIPSFHNASVYVKNCKKERIFTAS